MEQMKDTFYFVELAKTKQASSSSTHVLYLGDGNTGDLMLPAALVFNGQVVSINEKLEPQKNSGSKKYSATLEEFNFILDEFFPEKQGINVRNIIERAQKQLQRMRKNQVPVHN